MLAETVRMGFDREQLVESIRSRAQNKATVTYYLMCDNRRPGHGQYLRSELSEAQGTLAPQPTSSSHVAGLPASAPVAAPQQRLMAERRWRLGVHARGHPSALMAELYRLLQSQGICWKKMAPYNLKCRKAVRLPPMRSSSMSDDAVPDDDGLVGDTHMDLGGGSPHSQPAGAGGKHAEPHLSGLQLHEKGGGGVGANEGNEPGELVLKFECQMYKSRDDEYLIDMQRLSGDAFVFMETVTRILTEMRV
mmetsp:Transcript_17046/g.51163  ORF Transcript_17046/g.51163 Transcript_17046/m.51163 type:complete len:249 (-) Transcript_17046:1726-2472(-)